MCSFVFLFLFYLYVRFIDDNNDHRNSQFDDYDTLFADFGDKETNEQNKNDVSNKTVTHGQPNPSKTPTHPSQASNEWWEQYINNCLKGYFVVCFFLHFPQNFVHVSWYFLLSFFVLTNMCSIFFFEKTM